MIKAEDFAALADVQTGAKNPTDMFRAIEAVIRERIGFGLLTMLMLTEDGDEVQRLYTTDPLAYPVSGRERLGTTDWGQHVLVQQKPYLGRDAAGVKWAFPGDCDLIFSLGLGATMNIPIVFLGKTLGSMNILDREHSYSEQHLDAARMLAPYLVVPFMANVYSALRH